MQLKCQLLFIRICPPCGAQRSLESTAGSRRMAWQRVPSEFQLEENSRFGSSSDKFNLPPILLFFTGLQHVSLERFTLTLEASWSFIERIVRGFGAAMAKAITHLLRDPH